MTRPGTGDRRDRITVSLGGQPCAWVAYGRGAGSGGTAI